MCGIIHNDSAYYFLKNLQGDVIAITDNTGKTVVRYKYDAWGEWTIEWANCAIGVINPFRYRSYYYDNETGFYYLNSRYYDPKICRFINADDARFISITANNSFAYCKNEPVSYCDIFGFCSRHINVAFLTMKYSPVKFVSSRLKYTITEYFKKKRTCVNFRERVMDPTPSSFRSNWNFVKNDTIIIVDTHGNWFRLSAPKADGHSLVPMLSRDQVNRLAYSRSKLVILNACNAGHFDHSDNIACTLSTVVSGRVLASDGTVYFGNDSRRNEIRWSSVDDDAWRNFRTNTDDVRFTTEGHVRTYNYGWMFYRKGNMPTESLLIYNFSFNIIIDYCIRNGIRI